MIPDLRKRRNYRQPLPKWLRTFYLTTCAVVLGSVVFSAYRMRTYLADMEAVHNCEASIESVTTEKAGLDSILTGQAAQQAWRNSIREWSSQSTTTSSVQAATILSVIQAQEILTNDAEARAKSRGITRMPVQLTIQLLNVSIRADGQVDIVLDLACTGTEAKKMSTALTSCLAKLTPSGFQLAGAKPEERASTGHYTITWKRAVL